MGSAPRFENVATPRAAATDVAPVNVALEGCDPKASETLLVNDVTVFPNASRAVTTTGGMPVPAVMFTGCVVNARLLSAAGVMLNAELVALDRPLAVAWRV